MPYGVDPSILVLSHCCAHHGVVEVTTPTASMFIRGIGTAAPAMRYTKAECLAAFEQSDWFNRLDARSHLIARTVLLRDNGIDARRLAVAELNEVFDIDPDTLAQRFLANAPELAATAAERALQTADVGAQDIDAVVVSTCTGYLCPGLSGYVAERLGLRIDVQAFDLVGQGCGAALPNMQLGRSLVASGACAHVLSVCVEVSSAAMYLDNDPGVLISACLFGDGAGAAVLSRAPPAAGSASRQIGWIDTSSLLDPSQRDALKFESRQGMLRNVLTRAVPGLAAAHAFRVLQTVLARAGLHSGDIRTWILHAGGRDVLQAVERRFKLQPADLRYSAAMLREYGNLSSAFVYFVLQAAIADDAPAGWWWLSAFGAGFSCHGALLQVQG
jgi:predicted naringenin-chalcone synthase